jgi:caffeoyl-CoA O-methyltransferase
VARLVPPELERWAERYTTAPSAALRRVADDTRANTSSPGMMVGPVEGALLAMLVRLSGARSVVEVGTFTGYSALAMAEALPDDGELLSCELDPANVATARAHFAASPHGDRIRVAPGPALDTLRALPERSVDLVFVDADKEGYPDYYEEALRLLVQGGLLVVDNVLWSGRVLAPRDDEARAIVAMSERVRHDARVEHVLLTVRDGVLLVRKK